MKLFDQNQPFYRANFHCHTTMSDGERSPEEAVQLYRSMGYDILSITDHRVMTHVEAPEGLLLIPGVELDYMLPTQAVHIVGVGVRDQVMELWERDGHPQQAIDVIRQCGGRAMLAHPAWSMNSTELMVSLKNLSAVEVYNSISTFPGNADRADSSAMLDVVAAHGQLLPFVAQDDTHEYTYEVGQGWTMIQAEALTEEKVLEALDQGRFYASQGPAFHQIEVEDGEIRVKCSPVEKIVFYSNTPWVSRRARIKPDQTESIYKIVDSDRFVRVQITDSQGKHAWSSPISV